MSSGKELVRDLVQRFPQFDPVYRQHLEDNFGELLPHVIFWDLLQLEVASFIADGSAELDWRGVLDVLAESYAAGDVEVRGIIAVSFLEDLPFAHEDGYGIVEALPETLKDVLAKVRTAG